MATLTKEREKAQLEPVTAANDLEFVGGQEGEDLLSSVIRDLGTVVSNGIFAEQSTIEIPTGTSHLINESYSFKVTLVDKKGNKATETMISKAIKGLAVEVVGPSKAKVNNTIRYLFCFVFEWLEYDLFLSPCRPRLKRRVKKEKFLCRSLPLKLVNTKCL